MLQQGCKPILPVKTGVAFNADFLVKTLDVQLCSLAESEVGIGGINDVSLLLFVFLLEGSQL